MDRRVNILAFSNADIFDVTDKMFELIEKKREYLKDLRLLRADYRTLPKTIRQVIWLRYNGIKQKDIAKKLKISDATVTRYIAKYEKKETKNETTRKQFTD